MAKLVLLNSKSTTRIEGFPANHGITTRRFVDFGINGNPMERDHNLLLMKAVGANCFYKAITNHDGKMSQVALNGRLDNYANRDALICLRPKNGLRPILIANTADCPIAFLTDAAKSFIAIVHSGRVETEMNVVGQTIAKLNDVHDIPSKNIIIGLWPGICEFCYPVNLKDKILKQVLRAGIESLNIFVADDCCSAHSCSQGRFLFSSFRRDNNGERNAAFITF